MPKVKPEYDIKRLPTFSPEPRWMVRHSFEILDAISVELFSSNHAASFWMVYLKYSFLILYAIFSAKTAINETCAKAMNITPAPMYSM